MSSLRGHRPIYSLFDHCTSTQFGFLFLYSLLVFFFLFHGPWIASSLSQLCTNVLHKSILLSLRAALVIQFMGFVSVNIQFFFFLFLYFLIFFLQINEYRHWEISQNEVDLVMELFFYCQKILNLSIITDILTCRYILMKVNLPMNLFFFFESTSCEEGTKNKINDILTQQIYFWFIQRLCR